MRFGIPAQKPARGKIRPLGCPESFRGLQLGEIVTSLYAACPLWRAARIGALIIFISTNLQPFAYLSSAPARLQS